MTLKNSAIVIDFDPQVPKSCIIQYAQVVYIHTDLYIYI